MEDIVPGFHKIGGHNEMSERENRDKSLKWRVENKTEGQRRAFAFTQNLVQSTLQCRFMV